MVYHSSFVNEEGIAEACGCPLLPLKSHIKGPAPTSDPGRTDIVDEAITFFRANVFFRKFEVKSPADKLLIYLTLYINMALKRLEGCRTLAEGTKAIINLGLEKVPVPGEPGFPFGGLFTVPQSQQESELFRNYLKQVREETSGRLLSCAYRPNGTPNRRGWHVLKPVMAVAAFKSTSKRSLVGSRDKSAATTAKGRSDPSQNGAHRRSRSNDVLDNFSQSSSADIFLNGQMDFGSTTDNPLFRGSTVLEEASRLLEQSKGDTSHRRGRSLSRIRPNDNKSQSEVVHGQTRGRSVSRNHSIYPQNASNQKANVTSGRRGRSLSCSKYYESESDMDQASNRMGKGQVKSINVVENKRYNCNKPARDQVHQQQGLRRCPSQQNVSQSLDGYSSCASSVTDNEKSSMHPEVCVEEKTIKSVCEQIKSFESDHPTGDTNASGLNEVIRSEVQRAVAEIKFDLEQAIGRKSPSSPSSSGSISASQFKSKDNTREEYIAQLVQSEKRARDLWAQFAVEEQRCQELTKIVKDFHPDPQLSQNQRPSRTRKNSAERRKMSTCLTEAAQNYFDEYVSISMFEDSEMSSLEELENHSPAQDVRREKERSYMGSTHDISSYKLADSTFYSQQFPVHLETDGVVLPKLNCETNYNLTTLNAQNSEIASDEAAKSARIAHSKSNKSSSDGCTGKGRSLQNTSDFSQRSIESKMSLSTRNHADRKKDKDLKKSVQIFGNATQEGSMKSRFVESSSSYQDDGFLLHANNEAILIEILKVKSIIDFGGLLLCNKLHI